MRNTININIITSFANSFEAICHRILIDAYYYAIEDNQYETDWMEDQFTNYLIIFMNNHQFSRKHHLIIRPQMQKYNDAYPAGVNHPSKAPRIDIWIVNWYESDQINEYYFEAKNLSEFNWKKKNGSKVNASQQSGRYITTGIDNIKTGRYPYSSLIGYIVQGNVEAIVEKINSRLVLWKRKTEGLKKKTFLNDFSYSYSSQHLNPDNIKIEIKHFFLIF